MYHPVSRAECIVTPLLIWDLFGTSAIISQCPQQKEIPLQVSVKWIELFPARLQIFTQLCRFYRWATATPEEVFSCLDLPAHLLLFCLHKVITHKLKEPKSIQLQLTQTLITMTDGPPPRRMPLSSPANQITHHKQGHRLLLTTSPTFFVGLSL